jgi:hypothetical protein
VWDTVNVAKLRLKCQHRARSGTKTVCATENRPDFRARRCRGRAPGAGSREQVGPKTRGTRSLGAPGRILRHPDVHENETLLGCRPLQASHESPSWPQPWALEYLRAMSFLCSRHKVASTTTPPFSSACSQRMVRKVGPGFVRVTGAVFTGATADAHEWPAVPDACEL